MKCIAFVFVVLFALLGAAFGLKDHLCGLPPAFHTGYGLFECSGSIARYSYFPDSNSCRLFSYGGCGANANHFFTLESCEARCKEVLYLFWH